MKVISLAAVVLAAATVDAARMKGKPMVKHLNFAKNHPAAKWMDGENDTDLGLAEEDLGLAEEELAPGSMFAEGSQHFKLLQTAPQGVFGSQSHPNIADTHARYESLLQQRGKATGPRATDVDDLVDHHDELGAGRMAGMYQPTKVQMSVMAELAYGAYCGATTGEFYPDDSYESRYAYLEVDHGCNKFRGNTAAATEYLCGDTYDDGPVHMRVYTMGMPTDNGEASFGSGSSAKVSAARYETCVLAIRGTDFDEGEVGGDSDLDADIAGRRTWRVDYHNTRYGGYRISTHRGFARYNSILYAAAAYWINGSDLLRSHPGTDMASDWDHHPYNSYCELWQYVGHSLGGVMATMLSMQFGGKASAHRSSGTSYTFGALPFITSRRDYAGGFRLYHDDDFAPAMNWNKYKHASGSNSIKCKTGTWRKPTYNIYSGTCQRGYKMTTKQRYDGVSGNCGPGSYGVSVILTAATAAATFGWGGVVAIATEITFAMMGLTSCVTGPRIRQHFHSDYGEWSQDTNFMWSPTIRSEVPYGHSRTCTEAPCFMEDGVTPCAPTESTGPTGYTHCPSCCNNREGTRYSSGTLSLGGIVRMLETGEEGRPGTVDADFRTTTHGTECDRNSHCVENRWMDSSRCSSYTHTTWTGGEDAGGSVGGDFLRDPAETLDPYRP